MPEVLQVDPVTGRRTGLVASIRRALWALGRANVPFAVVGAVALAVRGCPRMTKRLEAVVSTDRVLDALAALTAAGFRSVTPVRAGENPEPVSVLEDSRGGEVDLLVAAAEPESTVVAEATVASVFGVEAPVATLEHLVLMYLYSNQPRHMGDLARIVTESSLDLGAFEQYLAEVHPEMLSVLHERVQQARHPPPAPARPPRRGRKP